MKNCKFFDWNYYKEALRQLRTVGVTAGVIFLLQSTLVPLVCYVNIRQEVSYGYDGLLTELSFWSAAPALTLIVFLMPLMVNILFDFLHQRNASDFYHSLPVRRETMYISNLAAIATWCLALFVIPALVETALFAMMPHAKITWEHFWYILADVYVLGMILMAALLLAKNLAGNRFGISMVMLMILFLPRLYLLYIKEMVEALHPYVILGIDHHLLWDNSWNLLFGIFTNPFSVDRLIYTLILAILYLVAAGILFVKRKSEKAEDVSIGKHLQLALRLLPALTFSFLPLSYIFELVSSGESVESSAVVLLVVLYVVAVVIYFLYELFTTKKLSAVAKSYKGLLWLAVGNVLLFAGISCYSDIQSSNVPEVEEVRSVQIYDASWNVELMAGGSSANNVQLIDYFLYNWTIQDQDVIAGVLNELRTTREKNTPYFEGYQGFFKVKIVTNSGTIYRLIGMADGTELQRALADVLLEEHFEEVFTEPDSGSYETYDYIVSKNGEDVVTRSLNDDVGKAIYDQFRQEFKLLDADTRYWLLSYNDDTQKALKVTLPLGDDADYSLTLRIDSTATPKTCDLVKQLVP